MSAGGDFDHLPTEPVMPKAATFSTSIPAFTASPAKSGDGSLDPILLFGGIGLMAFLVAILTGVQGVWY
jgi:hypothetical protein